MNKKLIRLTESDLHKIVKESVNRVVEDTRAQRKKDPMNQWFKDMDNAQKYRDSMEYVTKGGRKPKHWKQPTNEGVGNDNTTYGELKRAHEILSSIMNSGFIPFESPSPSSTEKGIKDAIIEAARNIDKAMYLCGQCGYN